MMCARRLAIVDVEGGENPISENQQRTWVALNGEIYNHVPLRREQVGRGAHFATATDTEVAAHLLSEFPDASLARFNGMFAMAVYNVQARSLRLVRDRLGQKPLYYTFLPDSTLLFASELKGLLVHPQVARTLSASGLHEYLCFEYVPAPNTIYEGIYKLEAGTELIADRNGWKTRRWWTPPIPGSEPEFDHPQHATERIRTSLEMAVLERMRAEVPVAYLLSGGIDSTAVAAMAAKRSKEPLNTFSVVFDEPSFDESGPASRAAQHIGSNHTEVSFRAEQLQHVLEDIAASLCEPIGDGSLPSMWMLARSVRESGFKVALSGDGADEHFGGYPTYTAHKLARAAKPGRGLIRALSSRLPSSTDNLSTPYLARRFSEGLDHPLHRRNQVWLGAFLPEEISRLTGHQESPWNTVDQWAEGLSSLQNPVAKAMFLDQRLYLAEGVLQKVDRASMAHSLEVRSPFLDHNLVELAAHMPTSAHLKKTHTKVPLRKAVADLLPTSLVNRPKKGFGTPIGPWLAGPQSGLLNALPDLLEGLLEPQPVRTLIQEHQQGAQDHRRRLWSLLILSRWWRGPWGPRPNS